MMREERIVNVDRCFAQAAERARDPLPLVVINLAQAQTVAVDSCFMERMRCTNCSADISRLKMPTVRLCTTAAP